MTRLLPLALACTLAVGCASNSRQLGLSNTATMSSESHDLWTRPNEIGFEMGPEISARASAQRVFGFNVGESKPGMDVFAFVGPLLGGGRTVSDPVALHAAYKAVEEANADGIYVTRIATEGTNVFFLWTSKNVTVYGRALRLRDLGMVDEARADDWRFRQFGPDTVIIKDPATDSEVFGIPMR